MIMAPVEKSHETHAIQKTSPIVETAPEILTSGRDFSKLIHPVNKPFRFDLQTGSSDKMPRIAVTGSLNY